MPAIPQPPSAASVKSTHVRPAWLGSPEIRATISVASASSCFWPSRVRAAGGVMTRTRTVRARKAGEPAEEVTRWFLHVWREVLVRSNFEAGCAVLAVAVAAESPELLDQTAQIFRTWRKRIAELLEQGGLRPDDAVRFAATLVASSEGAVVMARAEQSIEPFNLVAEQLVGQVRVLIASAGDEP